MINVFWKELSEYLSSFIAYIVIGVFLLALGLLMWIFPETNVLDYGYADMSTLFTMGPFVLMFLIPAVTMKMFSEELKTGSFEILSAKPVSMFDIVLGKFMASWLISIIAIVPTLIYFYSIYQLANPKGNIDIAGITGSYIGLILLASSFTAIGLLASSLTRNQVVSFVMATFLSFILFTGINSMANINVWSEVSTILSDLSIEQHYTALSKGVIDSRDVIYMISLDALILFFTILILRWQR
ncbi:MAG: gliding motility-associated ABC transporter permease subunit GldF [Bacteroidota bacterium]